jgi:hypothetical protein
MKLIPAYANFGFILNAYYDVQQEKSINPAAILKSNNLKNLHKEIKTELEFIRKYIKNYYNLKRLKRLTFSEGDMVYLATKNIKTDRLTHKLDYKFIGLYKVLQKISENNYKLDLPPKVRLHPVFHILLLESAADII